MGEKYTTNKMGLMPVNRLILSMGIPMILSMVLQAVYNIADSYFVSQIIVPEEPSMGDFAVNALTLAFPVQILMISIGVGTGIGVNAVLSKSLGENNREKAARVCGNAIFTGIVVYLVFFIFGKTGIDFYLKAQSDMEIICNLSSEYLEIITAYSFGAILFMIYEKLLQATGKTIQSMIIQVSGAVLNIILDPVFIFGIGFVPEMGIKGAAYATVLSQIFSMTLGIYFHKRYNRKEFNTSVKYIRPDRAILKEIYQVGFPAVMMQALSSVMTYGVNVILGMISIDAVTSYGILYKIQQFVFFTAAGMNNALIPVIAFNYGKQDRKRLKEAVKYGMKYTVLFMIAGMIFVNFSIESFIGLFNVSENVKSMTVLAVRICTCGYIFTGVNLIAQGILQSFGKGYKAFFIALVRMVIVVFILLYGFTFIEGAETCLWLTFPVAEVAGLIVSCIFIKSIEKYM